MILHGKISAIYSFTIRLIQSSFSISSLKYICSLLKRIEKIFQWIYLGSRGFTVTILEIIGQRGLSTVIAVVEGDVLCDCHLWQFS